MSSITDALAGTLPAISAVAALGTAAFGLVDAFKTFGGGLSGVGMGAIRKAVEPYKAALANATPGWDATLRANWVNGMSKDDQKTAAKTLIRLGLSPDMAKHMTLGGAVDATALAAAMEAVAKGDPLSPAQVDVFGRFNGLVDAAMDAGFELAEQRYRNASRFAAGLCAVGLSLWAGYLLHGAGVAVGPPGKDGAGWIGWSLLVGVVAVPVAPVAKDLASSLQAAATAVSAARP